ncbi:MAG: efflux RND transporter periplasmic adaptor subunit, partial [bacterium]
MLIHHPFPTRPTQVSLALIGILASIGGCAEEAPGPQATPPTEVTAVTVAPKDIPATYDFVGKTESTRKVEIRARVQGFLDKRSYAEGEIVKAGQTLFL